MKTANLTDAQLVIVLERGTWDVGVYLSLVRELVKRFKNPSLFDK